MHAAFAEGNAAQNTTYCSKDGKHLSFGTPLVQGTRTDLKSVFNSIQEGLSLTELIRLYPTHSLRYLKNIRTVQQLLKNEEIKDHPVAFFFIYGPSGSGKTKICRDLGATFLDVTKTFVNGNLQDPLVLFDDVDHDFPEICSRDRLLRLLDRYASTVNVKGSDMIKDFHVAFMTSNFGIGQWNDKFDTNPIYRRLTREVRLFYNNEHEWRAEVNSYEHSNMESGPTSTILFETPDLLKDHLKDLIQLETEYRYPNPTPEVIDLTNLSDSAEEDEVDSTDQLLSQSPSPNQEGDLSLSSEECLEDYWQEEDGLSQSQYLDPPSKEYRKPPPHPEVMKRLAQQSVAMQDRMQNKRNKRNETLNFNDFSQL